MGLVLLEAPAEAPVSAAEAQLQVRDENPELVAKLEALVLAATAQAEAYCRRRFIEQRWRLTLDTFPARAIRIDYPPLVSVESLQYVATDGTLTTVATSDYVTRPGETPGEIVAAYGKPWPTPRSEYDAVRVEFTCGYGAAADVPAAIQQAILLATEHLFDRPEAKELPEAARWLLAPYRVVRF